jgi:hypothetical protein
LLVLLHHTGRRLEKYKPPELTDLAYTGLAEFARQWILLNHREPFKPETGSGRLWLSAGGSAGQGGLWAVDTEEGQLNEELSGRRWSVTVTPAGEAQSNDRKERDREANDQWVQQKRDDELALTGLIDKLDPERVGVGVQQLIDFGLFPKGNKTRVSGAIERLIGEGVIQRTPVMIKAGKGATREAAGIRRVADA